jgi:hypothetical protein
LSSNPGDCKTVSFSVQQADASLDKVCANGCQIKFGLSDGESVVKTIDGNVVPAPDVVPEPVPTPEVGPNSTPEVVTSPEVVPNPSPSGQVSPTNTPQPYGRRRINRVDTNRRLMQYGGTRRLSQYGRRLNQYGRRLNQYGERRLRQYGSN